MKKPELLAPAGDLEKLKIALIYGADAVFIGGKQFSLRARASNFDLEDIQSAVDFAHARHKKVYVTTNIIPHPEDLAGLVDYLKALEAIKVDGIIAASSTIIEAAKTHTNLTIHLSTQQSITNEYGVNFWHQRGVERVVLGRELDLHEIDHIKRHTHAEIEVFIHGGMCVSYSGKCTLSNHMTERDANRGGCAHSCRWNYDLYEAGLKKNVSMPFSMSAKDLQSVKQISKLIDIGVDSLKIEGRMKSIHYIATVVKTYRQLIDEITEDIEVSIPQYLLEIKKAENRLTSHGFMQGMTTINEQLYDLRSEQPTQEFVGLVLEYDPKTQSAIIEQRNKFVSGDILERFSPIESPLSFKVTEIYDDKNTLVDTAPHPKQRLRLVVPFPLAPFDMLRKIAHNNG